jgi:hypothetical protein
MKTTTNNERKIMNKNNSVVAVYKSHAEAEAAVKELQQSGFDMKKLSIVGATITPMNTWSATTTPATA